MNINGFERRVAKLERTKAGDKPIRLVFQEYGETKKQAMRKAGITKLDANALTVFIFKWGSGPPDIPVAKPNTNSEIKRLKTELQADGMTPEEIDRLVKPPGNNGGMP